MELVAQHVPAAIQSLAPIINNYGYLAVFGLVLLEDFGVPTPGEIVLIAAAFFAGLGHLNIFLVFSVALAGAVIGDNIGFAIGHYGGEPLIQRFGKYIFLTPERVKKATGFFDRHGGKVIIIARFIEGLRQANGIIAGLSEMRWRQFLAFNVIGAALWTGAWSAIGYFGGNHIDTFLHYQLYFGLAVALLIVLFIIFKLARSVKAKKKH